MTATPWYRSISSDQWRALAAGKLGWMLDAFDFLLYVMAIGRLKAYFGFDDATAGLLGTITLLVSAAGGIAFGVVADRVGRARALIVTVLVVSCCSLGAATSQTLLQLLAWRLVLGIAMGGEWAAGAALVSESWPPEHRSKAIAIMQSGWALGYILAAVVAAVVLDVLSLGDEAWRWLFAIGALPAVFTLWVRRRVVEPPLWLRNRGARARQPNPFRILFGASLRRTTVLATLLAGAVQFGYWGLFFWVPAFLATPVEQGGAGMTLLRSMSWIIPMQLGAYAGYLSFGFLSDRWGRRFTFALFLVVSALLVPVYGQLARSPAVLMLLGPLLGFAGHGYFSAFGALLAELFPTAARATGQGLAYNGGRALGALAPYTIGAIAAMPQFGIGSALALTSAFFLAGTVLMFSFPDTSRRALGNESPSPAVDEKVTAKAGER
jgi:MFS family permease